MQTTLGKLHEGDRFHLMFDGRIVFRGFVATIGALSATVGDQSWSLATQVHTLTPEEAANEATAEQVRVDSRLASAIAVLAANAPKRAEIAGMPLTVALRWMGHKGFTEDEARATCVHLGADPQATTVRKFVRAGVKGQDLPCPTTEQEGTIMEARTQCGALRPVVPVPTPEPEPVTPAGPETVAPTRKQRPTPKARAKAATKEPAPAKAVRAPREPARRTPVAGLPKPSRRGCPERHLGKAKAPK